MAIFWLTFRQRATIYAGLGGPWWQMFSQNRLRTMSFHLVAWKEHRIACLPLLFDYVAVLWSMQIETCRFALPFLGVYWEGKGVRLHFLVDLIGHDIDLVEDGFKVVIFCLLASHWAAKLAFYVVSEILIGEQSWQGTLLFFLFFILGAFLAFGNSEIFAFVFPDSFFLRLKTTDFL